jgi:hypothetical protein
MALVEHGFNGHEDRCWNPVTLEDRERVVQHSAVSIIEGDKDTPRRKRPIAAPRLAKISQ